MSPATRGADHPSAGAAFRLWFQTEPIFARWFRVERPSLTREWMLVDWQPLVRR